MLDAGAGCSGVQAQDTLILREDYPKLLDPALGWRAPRARSQAQGRAAVPRHELVAMVELIQTCTQVKEDSRPSMTWVKAQMVAALRMGAEEYMAPSGGEQGHGQGHGGWWVLGGGGSLRLRLHTMSGGSPGMPHPSD